MHDPNRNLEHESEIMKATRRLHNPGQSLRLDNLTRDLLNLHPQEHWQDGGAAGSGLAVFIYAQR